MLKNISDAKLKSPFILFVGYSNEPSSARNYVCDPLHPLPDSVESNGTTLFLTVVKTFIKSSSRVTHVFAWERRTIRQLQILAKEDPDKICLHNCLSDFYGWINADQRETGFLKFIEKSSPDGKKGINVVVDSLSNPLFTLGFRSCVEELQKLIQSSAKGGPKIHQLLCMAYSDLLPCGSSSLSYLKHLANTVVELKGHVARITHCKPGGHVERKEERYTLLPEGLISVQPFRTSSTHDVSYDSGKVPLPQDVASFRVSLSEKEKEDRNRLVLPYMLSPEKPEEGGGKVFYQPDAVDDWDDEDPDDDLDV